MLCLPYLRFFRIIFKFYHECAFFAFPKRSFLRFAERAAKGPLRFLFCRPYPVGFPIFYFTIRATRRWISAATSARVASPVGFSVPSPLPRKSPTLTAQAMSSFAQSLTVSPSL